MAHFDELFKHLGDYSPDQLAALALNTDHVEVGPPLNTEQPTVKLHHSDLTFQISLPDRGEDAILHIEEIMQESPVYERIIQRGIQQGIEQGARQTTIENTLATLEARFPDVDVNALKPSLEAITDLNRLKALNLNASLVTSFHAFQRKLAT